MYKKGDKVTITDYDSKLITGVVQWIAFTNKTKSIVCYSVDFGTRGAFLVSNAKIIDTIDKQSKQLKLKF